ncbi:MAG: AAA family ATPase [Gammaproteobacteria bacterium]|nr:AAA family ATPase [Gammaproteobacteria bacterium]
MYEHYYGLTEKPFNLTPDTEFYYQSLTHQEALNVLLVAIKSGDGFIKLTGEVGTGKTLLCRKLLDLLDEHFQTIYIPNPYMSCDALLKAVVEEMGLLDSLTDTDYLSCINQKLIQNAQQGKQTIILLDEAQSLPVESLEAIRLLSNLETEKNKLIQIVLFGQPELDAKLQQKSIRQLQQRIVHACHLSSLTLEGLAHYIEHRLVSAGYFGPRLFSDSAIKCLYDKTKGVPRLINLLCHKSMMIAHASGEFYVSAKSIRVAARDSNQVNSVINQKAGLVSAVGGLMYIFASLGQLVLPLS